MQARVSDRDRSSQGSASTGDRHRRVSLASTHFNAFLHKTLPRDRLDKISVGILTWNVGDANPFADKANRGDFLSTLLPVTEHHYDLYLIGLQEVPGQKTTHSKDKDKDKDEDEDEEPVPATARIPSSTTRKKLAWLPKLRSENEMVSAFKAHMHRNNFTCIVNESLIQMRLLLFANNFTTAPHITSAEVSTRATGLLRLYGNKGGITVKLKILEATIAFVSCHLSAHSHCVVRRNEDMSDILEGVRIGRNDMDLMGQCTHIFVFGDLNYRLDPGYTRGTYSEKSSPLSKIETDEKTKKVLQAIAEKRIDDLKRMDQLVLEMSEGDFLPGFRDALWVSKHPHQPTFKIVKVPGPENSISVPISLAFATNRVPSYCDRILFWTLPAFRSDIRLQELKALAAGSQFSDHLPVSGRFTLRLDKPRVGVLHRFNPKIMVSEITIETPADRVEGSVSLVFCGTPSRILREITCVGHPTKSGFWNVDSGLGQLTVSRGSLTNVHLNFSVFVTSARKKVCLGSVAIDISQLTDADRIVVNESLILNGRVTATRIICSVAIEDLPIDGHRLPGKKKFSQYAAPSWTTNRSSVSRGSEDQDSNIPKKSSRITLRMRRDHSKSEVDRSSKRNSRESKDLEVHGAVASKDLEAVASKDLEAVASKDLEAVASKDLEAVASKDLEAHGAVPEGVDPNAVANIVEEIFREAMSQNHRTIEKVDVKAVADRFVDELFLESLSK